MASFVGFITGTDPSGEMVLEATSNANVVPQSQMIRTCENENQMLTGVVINESDTTAMVLIYGFGGRLMHNHQLKAYAKLEFKNLNAEYIGFVSSEVTELHVMIQKWQLTPQEAQAIFNNLPDVQFTDVQADTPYRVFDQYTHTNISSATTTTIAAPSDANHRLRVLQVSIAVISGTVPTGPIIEWTDADGTSDVKQIAQIFMNSLGTFIMPLGVDGLQCPNGAGGLLRCVSSNTASLKIDVIWQETVNNE